MSEPAFDFRTLPPGPATVTGSAVLVRLVEGIGFRFLWATESLRDADLSFRPTPETMSIDDLARHVLGLATWVAVAVGSLPEGSKAPGSEIPFPGSGSASWEYSQGCGPGWRTCATTKSPPFASAPARGTTPGPTS